ncbi:FAD-dependent monooxygenase [uncultured Streptomyces sp.]|uniref:FAD-dependent monooxygenase n=1 Tax=uncultured Streptomyces sp. TaxID=174707 RepID=UPI002621EEFF|nr:FAD-dependent monooxygenase [uncultured Streptomyces sp.]
MTDVLIVGAGPTGLTLACDLARRGIGVRIVDRSAEHPRSSRAKGPNQRSLEVFAALGIVDEVLASGSTPPPMRKYRDGVAVADTDPFAGAAPTPSAPYDRPWLIAQWRLEEILRARLAGLGVEVERAAEVVALTQDGDTVTATLSGGGTVTARYAVGCDGAHSSVRKLLGIPFAGTTAEQQAMVCGDVEIAGGTLDRARWHQWFDADGGVMLCPVPGTRAGWWFQASPERDRAGLPLAPTEEGFARLFARHTRLPADRLSRATLLSTYRVSVRLAERFRSGRVFLAGDAAHVHPIAGGLGMNTGVQDAFNLGWKLAHALRGAPAELLDSYEEERLPVAARTLDLTSERLTAVLAAITRPGAGLETALAPGADGLATSYRWSTLAPAASGPLTGASPQAGDRAPDAPCLDGATGTPTTLFRAFAGPHTTLLGFGPGAGAALSAAEAAYGDAVAVHRIAPADGGGGTGTLVDHAGHVADAYTAPGADGGRVVVVRPDHHIGLVAPADRPEEILTHLARLHGNAAA